jgi:hypothetical protein
MRVVIASKWQKIAAAMFAIFLHGYHSVVVVGNDNQGFNMYLSACGTSMKTLYPLLWRE